MQTYPIPAHSLDTAQKYSETAGSLAEALHMLLLRRPFGRSAPDDDAARAAYAQTVGHWYMENNDIISAALEACRLLSDGAALELENTREAAKIAAEPPSAPADGPETTGNTSSLSDTSNAGKAALLRMAADRNARAEFYEQLDQQEHAAGQPAPGGVLFYRQALINQPEHPRKKKGRADTGAGK